MAGASSHRYCVIGTPGSCLAALALSFYQQSDHFAFQHTARISWHSSTLAPESPAPPLHRVTAQPGRSHPTLLVPPGVGHAPGFALPSFSSAERSRRIEPLAQTGSSSAGRRHFGSPLPSHGKRKKANASTLSSSCCSSSPSHARAPPPQPLIKEIPPNTYGSPGR